MHLSTRFSRVLLTAGMMMGAAFGFTACGSDYALFNVHALLQTANGNPLAVGDRELISFCMMSITDENGAQVLNDFRLKTEYDSNGTLLHGCNTGQTTSDLGHFSYSTSRKTGSLKFELKAYSDQTDPNTKDYKVLHSGSTDLTPVKPFHAPADEIGINLIAK